MRRLVAVLTALAVATWTGALAAQQLPAAEAPVIVPPRVTTDRGVSFPEQALREGIGGPVVVTLVVEVDEQGHVRSASPEAPQGHGFDEAAVAAAEQVVFSPATRDGKPVAARITMKYTFTPPAPRLVGRVARRVSDSPIAGAQVVVRDAVGAEHTATTGPDGTWSLTGLPPGPVHVEVTALGRTPETADETLAPGEETSVVLRLELERAAVPADAGAPDVEEVTVKGNRPPREVTKRTLARAEIERSPGTHGDALLSLQNLPGVARPPPLSGALAVRGSAPGDTRIFIDGTDVPLVYHFGGLSSVVPTELLQSIDFYPGNYGATYGRGMGGVVDVGLRDPSKTGYHALGQIRPLGRPAPRRGSDRRGLELPGGGATLLGRRRAPRARQGGGSGRRRLAHICRLSARAPERLRFAIVLSSSLLRVRRRLRFRQSHAQRLGPDAGRGPQLPHRLLAPPGALRQRDLGLDAPAPPRGLRARHRRPSASARTSCTRWCIRSPGAPSSPRSCGPARWATRGSTSCTSLTTSRCSYRHPRVPGEPSGGPRAAPDSLGVVEPSFSPGGVCRARDRALARRAGGAGPARRLR